MKLKRVELKEDFVKRQVEKFKSVSDAFDAGAWIAGGFARAIGNALLLGRIIPGYEFADLRDTSRLAITSDPADIDMFFKDVESIYRAGVPKHAKIYQGFSHTLMSKGVKVQYVRSFTYPSVKACLGNFDIINSMWVIEKVGETFYLTYDPRAYEADKQRVVRINKEREISPFLFQRLCKYVKERGCTAGIEPAGRDCILAWISNVQTGRWPEYISSDHLRGLKHSAEKMSSAGLITPNEIALLFGKWRKIIYKKIDSYNFQFEREVDWASHEILERGLGNEVRA